MAKTELEEKQRDAEAALTAATESLRTAAHEVVAANIWHEAVARLVHAGVLTRPDLAEAQAREQRARAELTEARSRYRDATRAAVDAKHAISDAQVATELARRSEWAAEHCPEMLERFIAARDDLQTAQGFAWHTANQRFMSARALFFEATAKAQG